MCSLLHHCVAVAALFLVFLSLSLLPDTASGRFKRGCGETGQDPAPDPVVLRYFREEVRDRGKDTTPEMSCMLRRRVWMSFICPQWERERGWT